MIEHKCGKKIHNFMLLSSFIVIPGEAILVAFCSVDSTYIGLEVVKSRL